MVNHNGNKAYEVDNKLYQTQMEAKVDIQVQRAKIDIEILRLEQQRIADFRKKVGLTLLENDASVMFTKTRQAVIELAFAHEMGKTQYVIDQAALAVANTRTMYDSVCRKIFKICLKHGLKSEHLK